MKIVMELGPSIKPGFNGPGGPESPSYQKFHGPFDTEHIAKKFISDRRNQYPIEVRLKPQFSSWDLNEVQGV